MLVESLVCHACGAPKTIAPDSLVVYCDHCGAVVACDSSRDQSALDLVTDPGASGIPVSDREKTRRWMAASAAMGELLAADPEATSRFAPINVASSALCGPLAKNDPVGRARNLLAAWRTYYHWVASRLPEHAMLLRSDAFARSALRASLRAVETLLGEGVVARIRHEVLGDAVSRVCVRCGAALGSNAHACPYCGAIVHVEVDDPWVTGVLAQWAPTEERLLREGKLDELDAPFAAIQITFFAVTVGTGSITPEGAHAMLTRLVPWVPKSRLLEAIRVLFASMVPDAKVIIGRIRPMIESSWRADPSRRPIAK